jgi:hypothetical protein
MGSEAKNIYTLPIFAQDVHPMSSAWTVEARHSRSNTKYVLDDGMLSFHSIPIKLRSYLEHRLWIGKRAYQKTPKLVTSKCYSASKIEKKKNIEGVVH